MNILKEQNTKPQSNQIKYAQQHLANERTYLAWIRTSMAIVGIGFLTTELHFSVGKQHGITEDILAIILGVTTTIIGTTLIIISTISYLKLKRQIEKVEFYPKHNVALFVSILLILIVIIATIYILFNDSMPLLSP